MSTLVRDTLAELVSRRILILFGVITVVMLIGVWASWEVRESLTLPSGEAPPEPAGGTLVQTRTTAAIAFVMSIYLFFVVIASCGLIPRALEKGRAEFYLSKPFSRHRFLIGKLLSIWVVYGLLAVLCGSLVYVISILIHGGFDIRVLLLFGVSLLEFTVWLSVLGLIGVLTGSGSWAMMLAFCLWVAQNLLSLHEQFGQIVANKAIAYTVDAFYYVLPKTGQMGEIGANLASGRPIESWLPLWSSLLFATVVGYASIRVFERRDY
ncbi:MAG: hypothetical protein AB1772_05050 [Candidatus Zixiibacteriota bacterium]